MIDLVKIKKDRFAYLNKVYEEANGSLNAVFDSWEVGEELEFDYNLTQNVRDYLINEGLIESYALGGSIKLTHYGIKEVEQAYDNPEKPTEHFVPINYININSSGNGSIINTGNDNIFKVSNNFDKPQVTEKLKEIMDIVKADLTVDQNIKLEAIQLLAEFRLEIDSGRLSDADLYKLMTLGKNIASTGFLVICVFLLVYTFQDSNI